MNSNTAFSTLHHAAAPRTSFGSRVALLAALTLASAAVEAGEGHGTNAQTSARKATFVSKLGDNSDGSSWAKAFRTIQAALSALADTQGGCHIYVRPDTYMESNLYPAYKGAAGAYNVLEGDHDGKLGSGATGWVIIDSSDPGKGFKSYDWYGPIRAYRKGWSAEHKAETFSARVWDRWVVRWIYATGGDGGLFWDLVENPEPFTIIVEDCVGIGRAFGGGLGNMLSRPDEPSAFRRCKLWCLDWWGDAAGAYVRAENPTLPAHPDVVFEDCAIVGPDNALQAGNPGYSGFTRVRLRNCQLVSLNFSQPGGQPGSGVIFSTIEGRFLQVDMEDCTLMGYKLFGAGKGQVGYTAKGDMRAYVQFQQDVPKGFLRLGHWPAEVFQTITPAQLPPRQTGLRKENRDLGEICEATPVAWKGRLAVLECIRPVSGGAASDHYLTLKEERAGRQLAKFGAGYSLACAFAHRGAMYVYASRSGDSSWNDVTLFKSRDLQSWQQQVVIHQTNEHLFNSSVCAGKKGFVMAYESDDPKYPAFTIKFAVSDDLEHWTKLPDVFGADRYTACPALRYAGGYYYLLYTEHRQPRWFFETWLARSKDLKTWELSPANPFLTPGPAEGINASDPDLIEFGGQTIVYYSVGDQRTWMRLKRAVYPGKMQRLLESFFAPRK